MLWFWILKEVKNTKIVLEDWMNKIINQKIMVYYEIFSINNSLAEKYVAW